MSVLRRRMIENMQIRNPSLHTRRVYVEQIVTFARHFRKSPERLWPSDGASFPSGNRWVARNCCSSDPFRHIGIIAPCLAAASRSRAEAGLPVRATQRATLPARTIEPPL